MPKLIWLCRRTRKNENRLYYNPSSDLLRAGWVCAARKRCITAMKPCMNTACWRCLAFYAEQQLWHVAGLDGPL